MHEMSIAQNILEIVNDTLAERERNKLKEIVVDIGELIAVVPDSLDFCFEALVQDTKYEKSKLIINIIPLMIHCNSCNKKSKIEKYYFICPECDSTNIKVVSGEELNIRYLEVD
ncbi:hydrogenase maturation nickel metallochaperone HypA [Calditrichota bacterium]